MRLKASLFILNFFLIPLFGSFFLPSAYADGYVTYTAPNTLVFNQDTTNCPVPGSSYSVQLWSPTIGSTLIYNKANPSFPVTVDLNTLGLVNGNTYQASEFCAFGLHGSNRDNITFTYEALTAEAAPVTTASLATQNPDGSYSDPATVTLSATAADGFSVANTYYTLDTGGVQQTYTGPFTVSGPGSHIITYWSVDNNGIVEDGNRQTFTISDIFDVSNVVFNTSNGQMDMDYTGDTTLNGQRFQFLEIYNNTTSSRVVEYINNYGCDTAHCTFTDPSFIDPSNIHPGDIYSVRFELLNRSGINSIVTPTFIAVTPTPEAPPVTTANLAAQNSDGTYSNPTTVTFSATAAPGYTIANTYYIIDGGAQQSYTAPFTVSGNGNHTIKYWSIDNNGIQENPNTTPFIIAAYTLSGTVYNDDNQDGLQDNGEDSYQGATVTLNSGSTIIGTTTTDASGNYSFPNLQPGTYTDTLTVLSGYTATTTNPATVVLSANTTQNFGIYSAPVVGTVTVNPNPVQINTAITATANFTDGDITDIHTATINWDVQGSSIPVQNCQVTEPNGSTPGSVSCSLPSGYSSANIYSVTIKVSDNDGASGTSTEPFVSVYAPTPSGKFAAGQAYITPTGVYAQNSALATGIIQLGLSYKYNGTMPATQKQFMMTFGTTNITFSAATITSLVISNGSGTLAGTGTFSNSSNIYNFLVTGSQNNNTIRVQITDPNNNNAVIYDTQNGASTTAAPTTQVTGPNGQAGHGSVVAN